MEKDTVFGLVRAAIGSPNQVMIVPTGECGDFLVADRAETVLFFPQAKQWPPTLEVLDHLDAEAFLEVEFPLRVIRVGFAFDFGPPLYRRCRSREQSDAVSLSTDTFLFSVEHPVPSTVR